MCYIHTSIKEIEQRVISELCFKEKTSCLGHRQHSTLMQALALAMDSIAPKALARAMESIAS